MLSIWEKVSGAIMDGSTLGSRPGVASGKWGPRRNATLRRRQAYGGQTGRVFRMRIPL
jgi:hypothetical protein